MTPIPSWVPCDCGVTTLAKVPAIANISCGVITFAKNSANATIRKENNLEIWLKAL